MKKLTSLTVIIFLFSKTSFSQNAFYDAKKLISLSKSRSDSDLVHIAGILGQYLTKEETIESDSSRTLNKLQSIFYKQWAIKEMLQTFITQENDCEKNVLAVEKYRQENNALYNKDAAMKAILDSAFRLTQLRQSPLIKDTSDFRSLDIRNLSSVGTKELLLKLEMKYLNDSSVRIETDTLLLQSVYNRIQVELEQEQKKLDISVNKICSAINSIYVDGKLAGKLTKYKPAVLEKFAFDHEVKMKLKEVEESSYAQHTSNESSAAKLGIPSQAEVIDAMAIYLTNRVKLETALTFIEYIKKSLRSDSILLNLFPETINLFSTYGSYELPNFGSVWQQAFAEDFVMIPQRIASYDDTTSYFFNKYKKSQVFQFLHECIELNVLSSRKGNIIDIVQLLNEKYTDIEETNHFQKFIRIFYMLNEELFSKRPDQYWVSYSDFNKMTDYEFEVFVGLLAKKYDNKVFDFLQVQTNKWNEKFEYSLNLKEFKGWLGQIVYTINQFQNNQQGANSQAVTAVRSNENFWQFLPQLFKLVVSDYNQKSIIGDTLRQQILKYVSTYEHLAEIYQALEKKDYTVAFDRTIHILDEVVVETNLKKNFAIMAFVKDNYKTAGSLKDEQLLARLSLQLDTLLLYTLDSTVTGRQKFTTKLAQFQKSLKENNLEKYFTRELTDNAIVVSKFLKDNRQRIAAFTDKAYGNNYTNLTRTVSFINDVRRAGDSKTLSRVIASYANPPLSYKKKRASIFSLDINANVGVFVGGEFRLKSSFQYSDPGVVYGLSAPIGVSASWGKAKVVKDISMSSYIDRRGRFRKLKDNNFSLLFSIIDIGAAVAYRISTGPENALPQKVTFAQVIAPGLHAQWGIRNSPICFSIGGQYTPELRKFSTAPDAKSETAFSVRAALFFDLPLLNLARR